MAMVWWILTYLDNYRPPHALGVLAATNLQAHLFIKWAKTRPARRPVYKRVRGVNIWCGYEYIWDTPHLVEQSQPGNTFEHLFGLIPLAPTDPVWYYLFSIGERPFKECQSPLIHVPPPDLPMPSARIFHSVNQPIATHTYTILAFDSYLWDDYGFWNPAAPDRLTVPVGALYEVGASARLNTIAAAAASLDIRINGIKIIAHHSHPIGATGWPGASISLHCPIDLRPGDFVRCRFYHTAGVPREIVASPEYSPHLWIVQIGAYPISPP